MAKRLISQLSGGTVTPEQVAVAVKPLIEAHVSDTTPHPAYDDLASGRFLAQLRNGMA